MRRMMPTGSGEEAVAVGGGVDDRRQPPARPQGAADLGERPVLVGEVDQADAGDRGVEASRRATADRSSPSASRVATLPSPASAAASRGVLQDGRRDVGGEHVTGRHRRGGRRRASGRRRRRRRRGPASRCRCRASSSIASVAAPSQSSMAGPQRCQASAAVLPLGAGGGLEGDGVEGGGHGVSSSSGWCDLRACARGPLLRAGRIWTWAGQILDRERRRPRMRR